MKRLAILYQEEPIFLGPFLQDVIRMHPDRIAAVFAAGRRSAGEPKRTLRRRVTSFVLLCRLFECPGSIHAVLLRLRAALLRRFDAHSVEHTARAFGIPVYRVRDPNSSDFHALLRSVAPDAVLNQSEKILEPEVLSIPPLGFINRHASLLPRFRGRMAAFWAHAAEPPSYGLTIHMVDKGIDTGGILLQREFRDMDPRWAYPRVMWRIMHTAPALLWAAWDRLIDPDFTPLPNSPVDEPRRFPTAEDVRAYRDTIRKRRKKRPVPGPG